MRKLVIIGLFGILGLHMQLVQALGLGDIEVYSALNQPLEAEITLTSVRPGETEDLIVKLASEEAFIRAGVERPFYLTKLKFVLGTKPDGTEFITVTSKNPIREPFLNFLIDIEWPRGRLVREYTILLDPPTFVSKQPVAAPAAAPAIAASSASAIPDIDTVSGVSEPAPIERDTPPPIASEMESSTPVFQDDLEESADLGSLPPISVDTDSIPEEIPAIEDDAVADIALEDETDAGLIPLEDFIDDTESAEDADLVDDSVMDEAALAVTDLDNEIPLDEEKSYDEILDDIEGETDTQSDQEYLDGLFSEDQPTDALEAEDTLVGDEPAMAADFVDDFVPSTYDYPDINVVYDETIPYDEESTNAVMAEFSAEDGVPDSINRDHEVQEGDMLYDIASDMKPADVSVNQAMLAILRYNPDAFIDNNINHVKKGYVLRVPDREAMLAIDSAEALSEVRQQHALWKEYKGQLTDTASEAGEQEADVLEDEASELERLLSESADETESLDDGRLSLLAPGKDADSSDSRTGQISDQDGSLLEENLLLAQEQLEAERLEKAELQSRLDDLGEQVNMLQRLVSLKDQQLAALQNRLDELESGQAVDEAPEYAEPEEIPELAEESEPVEEQPEPIEEPEAENFLADVAEEPEIEDFAEPEEPVEESELAEDFGENIPEESFEETADLDEVDLGADLVEEPVETEELADESVADEVAEDTMADEEVELPVNQPAVAKKQPTGFMKTIYDLLPPPFNAMLADALDSPIALGVLGVIALVIIAVFAKLFGGKAAPKAKPIIGAGNVETEKPKAPSLIDRIKAMFGGSKDKKSEATAVDETSEIDEAVEENLDDLDNQSDETLTDSTESVEEESSMAEEELAEEDLMDGVSEAVEESAEAGDFDKTMVVQAPVEAAAEAAPADEAHEEPMDDTTAEADVYLAYGLFDQAEELLKQAMADNPDRKDYRGKLLETYFASGKQSEFVELAQQFRGMLGDNPGHLWDKTVAMGKEIAPDNELFSGEASDLKASDFAPAKPDTADLDLGEDDASSPDIDFGFEEEAADDVATMNFEMDEQEAEVAETMVMAPEGEEEAADDLGGDDLEFDLSDTSDAADDLGSDDGLDADMDLDFNADDLGLDIEEDASPADDSSDADDGMDIDLGDMDLSADDADDVESVDMLDADLGDVDLGDMDLGDMDLGDMDLDADDAKAPEETVVMAPEASDELLEEMDEAFDGDDTLIDPEEGDEPVQNLNDSDEVETKLDLAKAYLDMGDHDGASDALEEVLAEGNDAQRQEAEKLLEQIN